MSEEEIGTQLVPKLLVLGSTLAFVFMWGAIWNPLLQTFMKLSLAPGSEYMSLGLADFGLWYWLFGLGLVLFLILFGYFLWLIKNITRWKFVFGVLVLILFLTGAALFYGLAPLVMANFPTYGWFGFVVVDNLVIPSMAWPYWWAWIIWGITHALFVIQIFTIPWKYESSKGVKDLEASSELKEVLISI